MKGEKQLEGRSLKVVDSNTTFFGKLGKTLSRLVIPTKIGINGIVINMKRNNLLKSYDALKIAKESKNEDKIKVADNKNQEAYSLYLEAIDKHIMDSVYKKVKMNIASDFEKDAMGDYYKITNLKESEYTEYKYQKQKYLLELDYESLKLNSKDKVLLKYEPFYIEQMDSLYKNIIKNYSVKLAEVSRRTANKNEVYEKIFAILDEYRTKVLYIKIKGKDNELEKKLGSDLPRIEQFEIGELDRKDTIEKNMLLLKMSRCLFTHSLPLVAVEQCYNKLLIDARKTIVEINDDKTKMEAYNVLLDLLESYEIKLLSSKIYWENIDEREDYKRFLKKYEKNENSRNREIMLLKREIKKIPEDEENEKILRFYKNRLIIFGAMRNIKNKCNTVAKMSRRRKIINERISTN